MFLFLDITVVLTKFNVQVVQETSDIFAFFETRQTNARCVTANSVSRQRNHRLPRVPDDDGAQNEGHGQRRGDPRGVPGLRQGRQRLHFGRRTPPRHDQPGGEADGRRGGRDDPGSGHRRRRPGQLRRYVFEFSSRSFVVLLYVQIFAQEVENFSKLLLGGFKNFVRFYEPTLNCNISVNIYSI